jgi:hypothetical protein
VVITTNPTIFAKAVGSGAGYEPQVKNLAIRDTAVGDERRHQIALGPAPEQPAQFASGAWWNEPVNDMTVKAHLAELERQHKALEHEIAKALALSSTDDSKIAELKRRKLIVKDEIERVWHDHALWERRYLLICVAQLDRAVVYSCFSCKRAVSAFTKTEYSEFVIPSISTT